jgi:hypothetical protein
MNHLDPVKLTALMERTSGQPEIVIGLINGPVAVNHEAIPKRGQAEHLVKKKLFFHARFGLFHTFSYKEYHE